MVEGPMSWKGGREVWGSFTLAFPMRRKHREGAALFYFSMVTSDWVVVPTEISFFFNG
jgi:hypothetical protein